MMPDRLHQHAGHDAFRRPLHQFEREATADAVPHEQELRDPEMIHQPELVIGKGVPWVGGGDRAAGFAAIRVALVHRDATELVLEQCHRIEHRSRPVADARVQAAAGDKKQRKAVPGFLVTDADIVLLVKRHVALSAKHRQTGPPGCPALCSPAAT
jgi:hypothetical protein